MDAYRDCDNDEEADDMRNGDDYDGNGHDRVDIVNLDDPDDGDDPYCHDDDDDNHMDDDCDDDHDTDDNDINGSIDGDSDDGDGAHSKFGFRVPRKSRMPARRSTLWDSVSDEVHFR